MNRIVRHNFPASRLPEELRVGISADAEVDVTIEEVQVPERKAMTLEEIFEMANKYRIRTGAEIDAEVRAQRDEWDD